MARRLASPASVAMLAIACGAKTLPATPPPSPTAQIDPIARACVRAAACTDAHDPAHLRSASACVDWWLTSDQTAAGEIACVLSATSCADVGRCTHAPSDRGAETFCEAHPGALGVCDGHSLYSCSDEPSESTALDCATLGGTCVEQRIAGGLVVRGCTSPRLCPPGAPALRCEGERLVVRCEDGVAERRECPALTRCAVVGQGTEADAVCEGARAEDRLARCAKPGFSACEGDRATSCALVGREAWLRTTDCRSRKMTCSMRGGRASCVFPGATCAAAPRCDGESLVFCAAGAETRVSCTHLGFGRCDATAHGPDAACR